MSSVAINISRMLGRNNKILSNTIVDINAMDNNNINERNNKKNCCTRMCKISVGG